MDQTLCEDFSVTAGDFEDIYLSEGAVVNSMDDVTLGYSNYDENVTINTLPSAVLFLIGVLSTFVSLVAAPYFALKHRAPSRWMLSSVFPALSFIFLLTGSALIVAARDSANYAFLKGRYNATSGTLAGLLFTSVALTGFATVLPYLAAFKEAADADRERARATNSGYTGEPKPLPAAKPSGAMGTWDPASTGTPWVDKRTEYQPIGNVDDAV
ncbi:hypothetical protein MMC13_001856 [Lambiella insularis]|nr:hypothetical protein [Lambiella insularis]